SAQASTVITAARIEASLPSGGSGFCTAFLLLVRQSVTVRRGWIEARRGVALFPLLLHRHGLHLLPRAEERFSSSADAANKAEDGEPGLRAELAVEPSAAEEAEDDTKDDLQAERPETAEGFVLGFHLLSPGPLPDGEPEILRAEVSRRAQSSS